MDIHKDIIDSYLEYRNEFRTEDKWTTAEAFTKKILDYAKNRDLMFSKDFHSLVFKLVELNEKPGNGKTPYTAEKPNFAILISIVKNFVQYSKEYGIDFLQELLMHFEESAFTGIFGKDGGIDLNKYYRVVYRFFKIYLGGKLDDKELNSISNTLVYRFLEEIEKDNNRDKKRTSDLSIYSQTINTKKRRGEGLRKRKTRHKKSKNKQKQKYKKRETIRKYRYKKRATRQSRNKRKA